MSKPLKCEIKLKKDFEGHERQKTEKQWINKALCSTWMYSMKIWVGEGKRRAVINSILLNFHGN